MSGQVVPLAAPITGRNAPVESNGTTVVTTLAILRGQCRPLGATVRGDGVNFALFSRHAQAVTLLLFVEGQTNPIAEVPLDAATNRTGDIWHVFVRHLPPGVLYGYRVHGPYAPRQGHRFSNRAILLDPYAKALSDGSPWGQRSQTTSRPARLGQVIADDFDWEDDRPPRIPLSQTIVYEVHTRGFTQHPSSGVKHPGTFLGLIEKIPYLKSLGITAVQLMPIMEFDELDLPRRNPTTGQPLRNYWGYAPLSWFAPKAGYATAAGQQVREFKELIKQLHRAGIEVILDVVYNHTTEGNENGPTLSFRGLDNVIYYALDKEWKYENYSGCGNTVNCGQPVVRQLILDSLCEMVAEYHVDGFRFDLAAILARGPGGKVPDDPPLVQEIAEHPILAGTKLFAEAWDAAGLNLQGKFPSWGRWAELNGAFRDDVRRFVRSEPNATMTFAKRINGSLDLFGDTARGAYQSVNFITCHDGFTLCDLVSYNKKHNQANGEENKDGWDDNISYNCGHEGPTTDPAVQHLRQRQMRNFLTILLLSQGVPLLLMGDEFARTQQGNNNAYCQDNEISWVDWTLEKKNTGLVRFVTQLIVLRKKYFTLSRDQFVGGVTWHGEKEGVPDWSGETRTLALQVLGGQGQPHFYVLFNAHWEAKKFSLPRIDGQHRWRRLVDTSLPSPDDIVEEKVAVPLNPADHYVASARSVVVLMA